tara:strand:+ start:254 stop:1294 length:1041 start_codon:yes stop_codon:yes gene_type:complete
MPVKISKPAINLREELASLRNQGGLPKEDKLYLDDLVTNGDFSNGTTGWSVLYGSISVSSGVLTLTEDGSDAVTARVYQSIPVQQGKTYVVKASVSNATAGTGVLTVAESIHALAGNPSASTANGDLVVYYTASSDSLVVAFSTSGSTARTVELDNVSVQEVGENLVTNGTFDYDSGWTKGTGWTISGGTASSDGSQTSAYSELSQVLGVSVAVGDTFTVTYTVSNYGAGAMTSIFGNDAGTARIGNGTFTDVYTGVITTSSNFKMRADTSWIGNVDNIIITKGLHPVIQSIPHGYDVKDVYIDGELAREGEAYDYQVQTDGINQWLKPTVEPTATTETVVIGVRK